MLYDYIFKTVGAMGCHQLPERSFFIRGRQFPMCARCTGVWAGYLLGICLYAFYKIPIWLDFLFCELMFADWLIQYIDLRQSTNIRRLITGLLCGAGLIQLEIRGAMFLVHLVFR